MDIEILQEERLRAWGARIGMPQGGIDALAGAAQEIRADEDLSRVFAEFYERTALRGEWHREWSDLPFDPLVTEKMGERDSLFYLLGYMAALPNAEREYRRRGIPLDVFNHTMTDLSIWFQHEFDLHGRWLFRQFAWVWRHLDFKLFRLGRLQFMLLDFPGKVTAFRNRQTGRVILLGDPAVPLRTDGYANGTGDLPPEEDPWHAVFEPTPAGWRGNSVSPRGFVQHQEIFLLRSEWAPALKCGDTVLDLHIPRGEKLTDENCRDSFQRAFAFFPEYFPERPFKGVYCHTWFFTPQLQDFLPAESNIARFQREFYLYPHKGGPGFLWSFVFGERYPFAERANAPRDTALRKAVLEWLDSGKELFDMPGVMLHSPDEWGTQPYYQ